MESFSSIKMDFIVRMPENPVKAYGFWYFCSLTLRALAIIMRTLNEKDLDGDSKPFRRYQRAGGGVRPVRIRK